jgi:hypothetical protein
MVSFVIIISFMFILAKFILLMVKFNHGWFNYKIFIH